jgi:hypothetical protein
MSREAEATRAASRIRDLRMAELQAEIGLLEISRGYYGTGSSHPPAGYSSAAYPSTSYREPLSSYPGADRYRSGWYADRYPPLQYGNLSSAQPLSYEGRPLYSPPERSAYLSLERSSYHAGDPPSYTRDRLSYHASDRRPSYLATESPLSSAAQYPSYREARPIYGDAGPLPSYDRHSHRPARHTEPLRTRSVPINRSSFTSPQPSNLSHRARHDGQIRHAQPGAEYHNRSYAEMVNDGWTPWDDRRVEELD